MTIIALINKIENIEYRIEYKSVPIRFIYQITN
jgi:hypothetical protein